MKLSRLGRILTTVGTIVLAGVSDALTVEVQKARKDAILNTGEIVTNVTFDLDLPYGAVGRAGLVQPLSVNATNQSGIVFENNGTVYVNADSEYGLYRTASGKLAVSAATLEDYEEGTSWYKPITPAIIYDILDPFATKEDIDVITTSVTNYTVNATNALGSVLRNEIESTANDVLSRTKPKQANVDSPIAATHEAYQFIDTITQNADGVITATKKTMRKATTSAPGMVQLNDNLDSTRTDHAATANAVRKVAELTAAASEAAQAASAQTVSATNSLDLALREFIASDIPPTVSNTVTKAYVESLGIASMVEGAVNDNFASLDEDGDLADSGYSFKSFAPSNSVVYKVDGATNDNLAVFAADGSIKDTGVRVSQFATAAQGARADRAVVYRTDVSSAVDIGTRINSITVGRYSVVEGVCEASGDYSHAEGYDTKASGDYSHAEGCRTSASGYSHAEGCDTSASGYSHAEGRGTSASGYSHAEGYLTKASGNFSHAEGCETTTTNNYEHAQGLYNLSHKASNTFGDAGNTLSSIGFGNSENNRTNAVETMQDGKTFIYGLGGYDGTNPTNSVDLASSVNNKSEQGHTHAWTEIGNRPTKVSDFTNDVNYIKLTEFKQAILAAVTNDIPVITIENFTEEELARSINELAGALNRLRAAALVP